MQEIIAPESTFRSLGRKMCPDWSPVHTPMPCRAIRIADSAFGKPWLPVDTEGTIDYARQRDAR